VKLQSETLPKLIAFLEKQLGRNNFIVGNKVSKRYGPLGHLVGVPAGRCKAAAAQLFRLRR